MRASIVLPYARDERSDHLRRRGPARAHARDRARARPGVGDEARGASRCATRDATALANQLDARLRADGNDARRRCSVVVDARTNSLVVQGAPARVRAVREYDRAARPCPSRSASGFHVVRVVNADAETLADTPARRSTSEPGRRRATRGRAGDAAASAPASTSSRTRPPTRCVIRADGRDLRGDRARDRRARPDSAARRRSRCTSGTWRSSESLELGFDALIPLIVPERSGRHRRVRDDRRRRRRCSPAGASPRRPSSRASRGGRS